jgi:hypothetical protein
MFRLIIMSILHLIAIVSIFAGLSWGIFSLWAMHPYFSLICIGVICEWLVSVLNPEV